MFPFSRYGKTFSRVCIVPPWCTGSTAGFGTKGLEFKIQKNTAGIRQEGYSEFKVLRCSHIKSDSKASVQW